MNLDAMVEQGYREARQQRRVSQVPHRRAWIIDGREYSDLDLRDIGVTDPTKITAHQLSMLQLMQTNIVTRREAMERMVFV